MPVQPLDESTSAPKSQKKKQHRVTEDHPFKYAYLWLLEHGYSPAAAAGIVGNLNQESGINPLSNQDDGPGRGIAQWSEGARWDSLLAWAKQKGLNPNSLETQLGFLDHEMVVNGWKANIKDATNVANATAQFMNDFERPDPAYANLEGRVATAQDVYNKSPEGRTDPQSGGTTFRTGYGAGAGTGNSITINAGGGGAPQDKLSGAALAESYGWAYSFLKTEPELFDLFKKANNQDWNSPKFQAELRDTKWFQSHSESMRKAQYLKETDPKTYQDRLGELRAQIADTASAMGSELSKNQLHDLAVRAYTFGLTESQVQNVLADNIRMVKGSFTGQAGTDEDALRAYAKSMGVNVSNQFLKNAVRNTADGSNTIDAYQDHIRKMAMSAFPTFRDELRDGTMTMEDMASGYMQSMASILEKNPAEIDLFDPTIRSALSGKGPDGKPAAKTIWQFEQDLRKDPLWLNTKNAMDSVGSAAQSILSDFGFGW